MPKIDHPKYEIEAFKDQDGNDKIMVDEIGKGTQPCHVGLKELYDLTNSFMDPSAVVGVEQRQSDANMILKHV